jgi:hypothetical protein
MTRRYALVPAVSLTAAVLAGCGGDDDGAAMTHAIPPDLRAAVEPPRDIENAFEQGGWECYAAKKLNEWLQTQRPETAGYGWGTATRRQTHRLASQAVAQ